MTMSKISAKERLIETASSLFSRRGFSKVGVDEIIEAADTAKASFYQHFPTKEKLIEAWLKRTHEKSEVANDSVLKSDISAIQKIGESFDSLMRYMQSNQYQGCPYSNSCAIADIGNKTIRTQIEIHKQAMRSFYRKLALDITPDKIDADQLGDRIFLLYSGATMESQNLREIWPVEAAKSAALELCEQLYTPEIRPLR